MREQRGFTIIEVVLVLAIAGLIFLVVFLAYPQLAKSRRDTVRRNDAGRVMATVASYGTSNNGRNPTFDISNPNGSVCSGGTWNTFQTWYLSTSTYADPSAGAYTFLCSDGAYISAIPDGSIMYAFNAACDGETITDKSGRLNVAVMIGLERGQYCVDNQ